MNFLCKLGIHSFVRASDPIPTKEDETKFDFIIRFYALGECGRCGTKRMIHCFGAGYPYFMSQVKTKEEWLKYLTEED